MPRKLPKRNNPSRWGERLLFAAVDLVITFQLTGTFLFMDRKTAWVPWWHWAVFLLCAAALVFPLKALAGLLRRWDERGVFRARPRRGGKMRAAGWIVSAAVFLLVTALARQVLPDLTAAGCGETEVTVTVTAPRRRRRSPASPGTGPWERTAAGGLLSPAAL